MLNLFYSESYWGHTDKMNGPKKVVCNLLESLDQENIPYAINEEKYKYNFILQYDYTGHEKHSNLHLEYCVIGPQIWMFDDHVSVLKENPHYYKSIVAPSQWVKDLYVSKFKFPEEKISVWPVGLSIPEVEREHKWDCIVYYKRRNQEELNQVKSFLDQKNLSYNILEYGSYHEDDIKNLIPSARFCFLLNGTESQGIAVQEIMAIGTPLIVWDITTWEDQGPQWSVPATSVPYWSDDCGEKFFKYEDLEETFQRFYSRIDEYNPRQYVVENLSYKASVDKLLEIFNAN